LATGQRLLQEEKAGRGGGRDMKGGGALTKDLDFKMSKTSFSGFQMPARLSTPAAVGVPDFEEEDKQVLPQSRGIWGWGPRMVLWPDSTYLLYSI
jgi:hypothetical protein